MANFNFTNSSFSENYLTLTFHFSNLLNSNFFQKVMRQVPTWTLVEFWCGSFKSHPTLPLICPRSLGCIHPSMLTHEANCRERGAALVKPKKWRPEVSSYPLMTAKSSIFIPCIDLTTLTYFDWTSGVRIASYSRRFKCIRSYRIFQGGGDALVQPAKWRPDVSSCPLMTIKSSIFIPCIYLTTLTHFDWTSGVVRSE